jgi:hypothetical protein
MPYLKKQGTDLAGLGELRTDGGHVCREMRLGESGAESCEGLSDRGMAAVSRCRLTALAVRCPIVVGWREANLIGRQIGPQSRKVEQPSWHTW